MTRIPLFTTLLLVPACGVEELQAILDKYDTFGSTGTTTDTSTGGTSTGEASTGSPHTDAGDAGETQGEGTQAGSTGAAGDTEGGTSTTAAETGEETTGGPASVCGDGMQEGEEECDDANDVEGDGCLNNCTRTWLVFVTSNLATQGDLGGVVGADYECRHRATKLFLRNGERYKAWIGTSEVQPVDRLYHARGPYKLINGLQVAANWDALVTVR